MNMYFNKIGTVVLLVLLSFSALFAQEIVLEKVSTYSTGIFDDGAAEIAAYHAPSKQVFFTNSAEDAVEILDVSDLTNPTLVRTIDISQYGGGINSVRSVPWGR